MILAAILWTLIILLVIPYEYWIARLMKSNFDPETKTYRKKETL